MRLSVLEDQSKAAKFLKRAFSEPDVGVDVASDRGPVLGAGSGIRASDFRHDASRFGWLVLTLLRQAAGGSAGCQLLAPTSDASLLQQRTWSLGRPTISPTAKNSFPKNCHVLGLTPQ